MLIICEGLDASGKSTLANYLCDSNEGSVVIRKKYKELTDIDLQELIKYEWLVLLSGVISQNPDLLFIADRSYLTSLTFQKMYSDNDDDNSGFFNRSREHYEYDREHTKSKFFTHQYLSELSKKHNILIVYLESDVYELDNTLKTVDEKLLYKTMLEDELKQLEEVYHINVMRYNTSEIPFTKIINELNEQIKCKQI